MDWLALDIGGANLKVADGQGYAATRAFSMWEHHAKLALELRSVLAESPPSDHLAVTMTGELADCFEDKVQGVQFILKALQAAADGRHTRVYLLNGMLVTPAVAMTRPMEAASSNWHALARFAGRYAKVGAGMLIDIGSTTCDLVPLAQGQPAARGATDLDRLLNGELVYSGVERSPVCALVRQVPYRGRQCPVAQELFATTGDVYLVLGLTPEEPQVRRTADRRPATRAAAQLRLARLVSATAEQFQAADAAALAQAAADAQRDLIVQSARQVMERLEGPIRTVVISGQGEFLARRVIEELSVVADIVSLSDKLGPLASRCAPAHALAVLAREMAAGQP